MVYNKYIKENENYNLDEKKKLRTELFDLYKRNKKIQKINEI